MLYYYTHHQVKFKDGFTLIELIVVVAILAFLATLAIPRVTKVISRARDRTYEANVTIIKNALERYYVDYENYPDKLEDLVPDYLQEVPKKISDNEFINDNSKEIIKDKEKEEYIYLPSSDRQSYTLDADIDNSKEE